MVNSYQTQCRVERAGRWVLLPMLIITVAALLPLYLMPATWGRRSGYSKQEVEEELEDVGEANGSTVNRSKQLV